MKIFNLTIDGQAKQYEIPDSWKEVSISKFRNLAKIEEEGLTQIELEIKKIALFTGIDEDALWMFKQKDMSVIREILEFTTEPVKATNVDSVTIQGEEFFIKKDFDDMNNGEIISINIIMEKAKGNYLAVIPELLCIFLRKKVGEELEEFDRKFMNRKGMFEEVSIADVNDVLLFFSGGRSIFRKLMKEYSVKQEK